MKNGETRRGPFSCRVMRGLGDAAQAADAGADQHAGALAVLVVSRLPARVVERLRAAHMRIDDELVDLALVLRLHPLVGIEGRVAAVAARHLHGDLAGEVRGLESLDRAGAALAGDKTLPRRFDAARERRDHAETGNHHPAHRRRLLLPGVATRVVFYSIAAPHLQTAKPARESWGKLVLLHEGAGAAARRSAAAGTARAD